CDLAWPDPHPSRPRHPGRAHPSADGLCARPQCAAHLHAGVCRGHGARRPRRRDRRQLPGHRTRDGLHHGADRLRRRRVRRPRFAPRLLHRGNPDGHDPDLCRGVRRLARRPAGKVRRHGDLEHAVPRTAYGDAAAHRRAAAVPVAGADPRVPAAGTDGDTRHMNLLRRHWLWLAAFVVLLAIPFLFFDWSKGRHSGFVLTLMSEIGLMAIFALSYNMLMGQAGLLSFGHAVLLGMGAYCAAHVVLLDKAGSFWLPAELVPLAG